MTIFVPLIFFDITEDDKEICDYILQGFRSLDELRILYPDAEYIELESGKFNVHDN